MGTVAVGASGDRCGGCQWGPLQWVTRSRAVCVRRHTADLTSSSVAGIFVCWGPVPGCEGGGGEGEATLQI